ncbi:MAG: hypothetical protein NTX25_07345 [Proteobacteria bacterium]|nr:hypothetical protein [Pseudomonadota bacterium]
MAVVVFECPIDDATFASIQELRVMRIQVLQRQIKCIDEVVDTLFQQGTLEAEERGPYRGVILEELQDKCAELQTRLDSQDMVYSDELELYLEILNAEA